MRVAVVSDIHANYMAFEAFLTYIEKYPVDAIIGLGDYITDCPYPQRTMTLLYDMIEKYPCYLVRGNREEYLLNYDKNPQGWEYTSPNGALLYTFRNTTRKDLDFFETLPIVKQLQLGDTPKLTICHGTPTEVRGNMSFGDEVKNQTMDSLDTEYLLGGHSHHQEVFVRKDKMYINPGSLGCTVDFVGGRAEFAIMEGDKEGWRPQLISISYDVDSLLKEFTTCGLDEYGKVLTRSLKKTLRTGTNYFYLAVCEALKIKNRPLPEIEEEIWEEVAKKLEL